MEKKSLHTKILLFSLACIILFTGLFFLGLSTEEEVLVVFPALFISFSLISIITLYAIRFQEKTWLRNFTKFSSFLLPFLLIMMGLIVSNNDVVTGYIWILIFSCIILSLFVLIQLFIFSEAYSLTGMILFILLIMTGLYMKRMHWPLSGLIISIFTFLLSSGCLMFGIRCIFLGEKSTYFRNITFIGSIFLAIAFTGQLFKIQHWAGAGSLAIAGFTVLILGTIYVLITLHSSDYIDWQPFQRKIFRKILIPWTFILIMYISRYMVPELNTLIWTPDPKKKATMYGFNLREYDIEKKNGLDLK